MIIRIVNGTYHGPSLIVPRVNFTLYIGDVNILMNIIKRYDDYKASWLHENCVIPYVHDYISEILFTVKTCKIRNSQSNLHKKSHTP